MGEFEDRWHVVYRFFDGEGRLLYVGISATAASRITAHADQKDWFRQVVRAEFEHVWGRDAAEARELEIIQTEDPVWNRAGKPLPAVRALFCGSRTWREERPIRLRLALLPARSSIIHGGAAGADRIAGRLARTLGIPAETFPADWATYGKRAGVIRNAAMLDTAPDLVVAFQERESRGTQNTIDEARRRGIPVEVYGPDDAVPLTRGIG